jgi:hypothetical protein
MDSILLTSHGLRTLEPAEHAGTIGIHEQNPRERRSPAPQRSPQLARSPTPAPSRSPAPQRSPQPAQSRSPAPSRSPARQRSPQSARSRSRSPTPARLLPSHASEARVWEGPPARSRFAASTDGGWASAHGTGGGTTPLLRAMSQPRATPVLPSSVFTILNSTRRFFSQAAGLEAASSGQYSP